MRVNGQSGFTLVEMIMVIVITGILGSMAAVFLRAPVQQYMDAGLRADLTDIADLALRRMANDIRTAVPSSVRPTGTTTYIEFLPTNDGGRYRAVSGTGVVCAGVPGNVEGDALLFASAVVDTCFEILGPAITFSASDKIVIGNTQPGAYPYDMAGTSGVMRAYNGAAGAQTKVVITSAQSLPAFAAAPNQRFEVVPGDQQAVTYACVGTLGTLDANQDGQGKLVRYWNYGISSAQSAPAALLSGSSAVLANKLSDCSIFVDQGRGLIANTLQFTRASEVISLYQEIHVNNASSIHVHNTP